MIETRPETAYPALEGNVEVDVVVVGAGITGLMTAWLLKFEGRRVAAVEMRRVAEGATGYTTAKLTVGHHLIYADLAKKHGLATARAYADSNQWAIERLEQLVSENGINCDWERAANFTYTEDEQWLSDLRGEAEAMRRAGISAELTTETDLSFAVLGRSGSTRKRNSIRKFLQALAEKIVGDGSHLYEQTLVCNIRSGDECTVVTNRGTIRAPHVVLATHLPFLDRGFFFAKVTHRSPTQSRRRFRSSAPRSRCTSALSNRHARVDLRQNATVHGFS